MGKLTAFWAVLVLGIAYPVAAQDQVPRTYPEAWPNRPVSSKTGDARAQDEARANADEAACASGAVAACVPLGDAHYLGEGRPQNRPVAELLYRQACDAAVGKGCAGLGILLGGTDRPGDLAAAKLYFDRACRLGVRERCESAGPGGDFDRYAGAEYNPELYTDVAAMGVSAALTPTDPGLGLGRGSGCTTVTATYQGRAYDDTVCEDPVAPTIINGFGVVRGKAPWQALLWRPAVMQNMRLTTEQRILCGGTVIRSGWILTAGHCLTDEGGVSIIEGGHRIRLGLNNPLADEGISYPIIKVIRHPYYNRSDLAFDIALIRYDTSRGVRSRDVLPILPVRFDRFALSSSAISRGVPAFTYGWGLTQFGGGGEKPDELKGARLTLLGAAECTALTKFNDFRKDSVLCASEANTDDGGQACNGDSGGPLITFSAPDGMPTVIGVVSGGFKCGTVGYPSRYTNVAKVLGWIYEQLAE